MAFNRFENVASRQAGVRSDVEAGLRAYMLRVYNYMALGVALTGAVVLFMAASPSLMTTLAEGPMKWVLFIAVLGMGWFSGRILTMRSIAMAQGFFWVYAALWGVMISPMVAWFLQSSAGIMDVARAFFITAGMFAGSSLYGYVTKRDLSAFGRFFMMASIGLMLAMLVNVFFVQSTGFSFLTSIVAVLLFAGITAWETQQIKGYYDQASPEGAVARMAIFGALQLYGSFVVMFIHVLNLLGMMRNSN